MAARSTDRTRTATQREDDRTRTPQNGLDVKTAAVLFGLALQILAGGFWAGRISTKVSSIDARLSRIEVRLDSSK